MKRNITNFCKRPESNIEMRIETRVKKPRDHATRALGVGFLRGISLVVDVESRCILPKLQSILDNHTRSVDSSF